MYKLLLIPFIALVLLFSSLFVVDTRDYAVVFQFGEAVRTVTTSGLHFQIPLIQKVVFFDNRIRSVKAEAKELTASDEKRIIVDACARYKILDPVTFYKTVYDYNGIQVRLNRILESSIRKVIGQVPLLTLLTVERSNIMTNIKNMADKEASRFGVKIVDVRIIRADLPPENSSAIYKRMETDRAKEAKLIRAKGEEEALRIRSQAERDKKIIIAEAYAKSEAIRGEGDSTAAEKYLKVFGEDRDFFKFYKSQMVYRNVFNSKDTTYIISPDSAFMNYLGIKK